MTQSYILNITRNATTIHYAVYHDAGQLLEYLERFFDNVSGDALNTLTISVLPHRSYESVGSGAAVIDDFDIDDDDDDDEFVGDDEYDDY